MARAGRVLVVQPAFLGDVVFTSALVDALADRFAEVDVCVTPLGREVALAMPRAALVQVFDKRGADRGPAGLWRTAHRLRERRYEAAALPHKSPRSALLAWLARIPRRVGFRGAPGSPLYTERALEPRGTFTQREASIARAFGADPRPMRLEPRPEWVRAAEERLRVTSGAIAALCVGSEWETKIWPAERFAALADRLAERGLTPVLLGGRREKPLAEAVQARAGARCLDTTGNPIGEGICRTGRLLAKIPDFRFKNLTYFIQTPDKVAAEYQVEALVVDTGKIYQQTYADVLHAENGKIKLLREALDTLAASKAFSKD